MLGATTFEAAALTHQFFVAAEDILRRDDAPLKRTLAYGRCCGVGCRGSSPRIRAGRAGAA